jgi:hypothetical protein
MLDETDFEARQRVKKPEWFLQPEETVSSRKIMSMRRKYRFSAETTRISHTSESPRSCKDKEEIK